MSYNWQCVSGSVGDTIGILDHPKGEGPFECAKRELFEETGYALTCIIPVNITLDLYTEREEEDGKMSPPHLQEELKEIK